MDDVANDMKVTLVLADSAQEAGGKLFLLGGGWTHVQTDRALNMGLGLIIGVPWDRTNERHTIRAALVSDDGEQVEVGGNIIQAQFDFEIGRPPGLKRGSTLNAVTAVQFNGLTLPFGGYVWEVLINGQPRARAPFWVTGPPG